MLIKKLSKEEQAEGLTLDFVNKINLQKKSSPVMFKQNDKPASLMKCSTGFWVRAEGEFLKDENGKLLILKERECQIARARYLFYHADEEKREEAEKVLRKRKEKIQNKLDIFRKNIDAIKALTDKKSSVHALNEILESVSTNPQAIKEENARKIAALPEMERQYELLVSNFNNGNINFLLDILGIEKIENPVTFKFDNEDDMRALKNAFGAAAINEANGDVNLMYARLKVEQTYNL